MLLLLSGGDIAPTTSDGGGGGRRRDEVQPFNWIADEDDFLMIYAYMGF